MTINNASVSDKILASTVLKLLPDFVTPNQITVFRIVTVPFVLIFLLKDMNLAAFILFTFSIFTDAVDGAMARTQDKITDFGKIADPVADKLLVGVTAIIVITKTIAWQLAAVIVLVDSILIMVGIYKKFVQRHDVRAEWSGKTKLILQAIGLISLLAFNVWGFAFLFTIALYSLYLSVFFALISLIVYRAI